jgi:ABC-type amino acid transport substrate-binding protein
MAIIGVPPYGMNDAAGHAGGIQADIAAGLARECGMRIEASIVPNPRARLMLASGEADLMLAIQSPALTAVARPLEWTFLADVIVIGRAGTALRSRADLRGKTLGHMRGTQYDEEVATDGAVGEYETATPAQTMAMLLQGRYDGVLGIRTTLFYTIRSMQIPRSKLGPVLQLRQTESWLHYSNKHYDPLIAARLQKCLATMRRRGDIETVIRRYLGDVPMQ